MKDNTIYSEIADCCSLNKFAKAIKILSCHVNDIDLTYKNGIYFRFAIKHNNIEMLNTLFQYYEKTVLKDDPDTLEYKVAKHALQKILKDAINTFNISEEMQSVLDKYLPKEEGSDQEDDFDTTNFYNENKIPNKELTASNLQKLDTNTQSIINTDTNNEHHYQEKQLIGEHINNS